MNPLVRYMQEHRLRPVQVARLLGVRQSQVSLWAHGKRKPSVEMAALIEERTAGAVSATSWAKSPRAA
jgi:DNA-binding transcriptional regulator YdaS (Cro superfamily)